jgi:hypothetical protein
MTKLLSPSECKDLSAQFEKTRKYSSDYKFYPDMTMVSNRLNLNEFVFQPKNDYTESCEKNLLLHVTVFLNCL